MSVAAPRRVQRNPCELAIELQCLGMVCDDSCDLESDARGISRNRAGAPA